MIPRVNDFMMDPIRLLTPRIPNVLQKAEDLLDAFPTIYGGESFHIFQNKHFWLLDLDHVHDVVYHLATFIIEAFPKASYGK